MQTSPPRGIGKRQTWRSSLCVLLWSLACTQALSQGSITDPTPGEIEQNLTKRAQEWRDWQMAESTRKHASWRVKKSGDLILVTSRAIAGTRNVTHITNLAKAAQKWLDRYLSGITPREPGPVVLRVCADGKEAGPFRKGAKGSYNWVSGEVVVVHSIGTGLLSTFGDVGAGLTRQYLDRQSPSFAKAMPDWLEHGLWAHVKQASMTKKSGFIFRAPRGTWRQAMVLLKAGTLVPVKAVVETPHGELATMRTNSVGDCRVVSELLVRYLTFSRGKKGRTRGFIKNYLRQMHADLYQLELEGWLVVMKQEMGAQKAPGPEARRKNFENYLKRIRKFSQLPEESRKEVWNAAFAAAFSKWTPANWRSLDKALKAYIQGGLR